MPLPSPALRRKLSIPLRTHNPINEEQSIHPLYAYLYVADKYEGLVVIGDPNPKSKTPGVSTLLDGDPRNNFLKRRSGFQSRRRF